jgi:hypothetical protein
LTTQSDTAAAAFDHVIHGYLAYRADMLPRMQALLAPDLAFRLGHFVNFWAGRPEAIWPGPGGRALPEPGASTQRFAQPLSHYCRSGRAAY